MSWLGFRENGERLAACPQHVFARVASAEPRLYRCAACGGELEGREFDLYERHRQAVA